MSASDAALLVIDAQESFRHRPYYREEGVPRFLARLQALIEGAAASGIAVVQIFHVEETGAFSEESGFVRTLAPLDIKPAAVFRKGRHSAFVGTGLEDWLTARGIRRIIVSGIRSEQCCETTARHACDLRFLVDYVGEATLTFPMTDSAGREWSPAEILARTELVLADRFARIATVEEALSGQQKTEAA